MERNLTTGSVFGNIVVFSLPYLLSYFLQTLYGLADLFIIGQFEGVAGTTAVSVGSQIMHMLTVMIVGLAMGTTVSIGQAVGAGKRKNISCGIGNSAVLFMSLSVVAAVILYFLADAIVRVTSTPEEAVEGTAVYLRICFIGIPFITAYNLISSVFRGLGDSKSPMCFIAVACAANIVLDYLFIGAMDLGPAGAALGTTLSQAVSVIVSLVFIRRRRLVTVSASDFRPRSDMMRQILRIGVPVCIQDGLVQVSFMVITVIANRRGLVDSAAVGIVEKMISFLFLVPSSMLSTVSALGAQNIGAGKMDRARDTLKYSAFIAAGFGLMVAFAVQFMSEGAVSLFTSDPAVIKAGGLYFRGYVFDCIFAGIHFCFSGYFCAAGKSIYSFIHNIICIALVRIPGAYLASEYFPSTLFPMGLATAAGSLLSVLICIALYAHLRKRLS